MSSITGLFLLWVITFLGQGVLTDGRALSESMLESPCETNKCDNTSAEIEMLDSHEAMNSREVHENIREKRNYEFLMSLINNNSKYEVAGISTPTVAKKKEIAADNVAATGLLLELIIKIAAHPDQWNKIHKLLQKLDEDLIISKNLLDKFQSTSKRKHASNFSANDYQAKTTELGKLNVESLTNNYVSNTSDEFGKFYVDKNKWPHFQDKGVQYVNNKPRSNFKNTEIKNVGLQFQEVGNTIEPMYHKNFAYHRVTGTPFNLNKNPRAYIAVSVIAPKSVNMLSKEDDISLENELRQLKPWTHSQNLRNMESIRSRWLIQSDEIANTTS